MNEKGKWNDNLKGKAQLPSIRRQPTLHETKTYSFKIQQKGEGPK